MKRDVDHLESNQNVKGPRGNSELLGRNKMSRRMTTVHKYVRNY